MKRYLSLWFPDWPLTRLRRAKLAANTGSPRRKSDASDRSRPPFALLESGVHGLRIAASNSSACKMGVSAGLAFTDAKARVPHLVYEDIDRSADTAALRSLAEWMIRFVPLVSIDSLDGLILETTGCDHLYGGEVALMAEISAVLEREGFAHCSGLAGTQASAKAISRANPSTILEEGAERAGLAALPITALGLSEEAEALLRRFGLTRIGQLYGIDRKALARRFQSKTRADAVLLRLDQALGLRHDPIKPLRPKPTKMARLSCPEPLLSSDGVLIGLEQLTVTLCADLQAFGQGARGFALHVFRSDGTAVSVEVTAARPVRAPQHILRLFEERIDQIDPGFGIDLLMLEARRTGRMDTSAVALSGDLAAQDTDTVALAALTDRICAKLGDGMVKITQTVQSHLPEQAECHVPFQGELGSEAHRRPLTGPRPLYLLKIPERVQALAEVPDGPPLRFVWRRVTRTVTRADGPERLSPEWWTYETSPTAAPSPDGTARKWLTPKFDPRADAALIAKTRADLETMEEGQVMKSRPRARDYYRVEDEIGRRYWLFRAGLYNDGRGSAPDWYVHGLFA